MALPYPPDDHPALREGTGSQVPEEPEGFPGSDTAPRVLRLRIAGWDVISTLLMWAALLVIATMTDWPSKLFGFTSDICEGDMCGPVPYGVDYYIHPLVWGGIGAAMAAAVLGPVVSMLRGWYMSFWPALAVGVLLLTSVVGSVLTAFSQPYWH
jgi:hypothetical protein